MVTEFIKSNKLRYTSLEERLPKIDLLCKQKLSWIMMPVVVSEEADRSN